MIIDSLKVDLVKIVFEKKLVEESVDKEKFSLSQFKVQLLELEDEFMKIKDMYEVCVNDLQNKLKELLEEMDKIFKDKQNFLIR